MGWKFYEPGSSPKPFDIVWCKWPRREDKLGPGPWTRCVLVLDTRVMIDSRNNVAFAAVTAAYGTEKEKVSEAERANSLVIDDFRAVVLHKPTVFKIDLRNRKRLPWCEEYFLPQGYVRSQNIITGSLTESQKMRVLDCFKALGLTFPIP
jgi:hypothetical protein